MADITAVGEENPSPTQDELQQAAGNGAADNRGTKRSRMSADDDDDDEDKPGRERRKIEIKFIQDKSRRHITFSKRKAGIMKKVRTSASRVPASQHLLCSSLHCDIYHLSCPFYSNTSSSLFLYRENVYCWIPTDMSMRSRNRHTNSPSLLEPKSFSWSCPRLVSSTLSQLPSCSHW